MSCQRLTVPPSAKARKGTVSSTAWQRGVVANHRACWLASRTWNKVLGGEKKVLLGSLCNRWDALRDKSVAVGQTSERTKVKRVVEVLIDAALCD
jgi:hypothetical protein